MSRNNVSKAGNHLEIRNPFVTQGVFQIAWGGLLLSLLVWFGAVESGRLREIIGVAMEGRSVAAMHLAGGVGFTILFVAGLGMAVASLFAGLKNVLSFIVPVNVPVNISQPSSITRLFFERVIDHFENPSSLLLRASKFFSDRFLFMVRPQARFVERVIGVAISALVLLVLSLLPFFLHDMISELTGVQFEYCVPYFAAFVLLLTLIGYVTGMLLLTSIRPEVVVNEERMHLSQTGNPNNFFGFLERKLDDTHN